MEPIKPWILTAPDPIGGIKDEIDYQNCRDKRLEGRERVPNQGYHRARRWVIDDRLLPCYAELIKI
jgi:hypothetical protein